MTTLATPGAVSRIGVATRLALLGLVSVLILVTTAEPAHLLWIIAISAAALPAWLQQQGNLATAGRVAEVILTAVAAALLGRAALAAEASSAWASAVLPYLIAPVVLAALGGRFLESVALLMLAAATLGVVGGLLDVLTEFGYLISALEWVVIAGLAGALAYPMRERLTAAVPEPQPYAEATRLLTQLRAVARQLPGGTLDPGGIAEHLLDEVSTVAPFDRAAVLSGSGGSRLVVLAQTGVDRADWETSLDADSIIADAWASQQTQVSPRSQARSAKRGADVSSVVVPLVAGVRTVGLVVLEADRPGAYPPSVVRQIRDRATPAALRLEAALLFDDVRSLATTEERQRLAREIHDGVAQELVMVGYGIDNALASLPPDATQAAEELRTLRAEVTRVITELRLSLFELRSEVDRQGGLAAAISEYARTIAAAGGLRVHFSVDDSTARLPANIEAELMRIAQEAITNARKHSGAQNLWVSCEIDPPYARIEVSDDGAGIGPNRSESSYGLVIMKERAERIRGQLVISPRFPSGTSVAVILGTPPRPSR